VDRHALLTIFVFVAPRGGRTRVWMRGERKAASGGLVYLLGLCGDGKCKNVQPKLILSGFMCHPLWWGVERLGVRTSPSWQRWDSGGLVYLLGLCGDGKCKNVQPKLILSGFMCHPLWWGVERLEVRTSPSSQRWDNGGRPYCAGQVLETTPTLVTRPLLR